MLATITKVTVTQAPKGYSVADVDFQRDGKAEQRRIMGFGKGKEVVEALQALSAAGQLPKDVNIKMEKNDKGYWNWVEVETSNRSPQAVPGQQATGKVAGSNYETREERARRQVYIVRQSSVSSAIALAAARNPKGGDIPVEQILADAQAFEQYVMNVGMPE